MNTSAHAAQYGGYQPKTIYVSIAAVPFHCSAQAYFESFLPLVPQWLWPQRTKLYQALCNCQHLRGQKGWPVHWHFLLDHPVGWFPQHFPTTLPHLHRWNTEWLSQIPCHLFKKTKEALKLIAGENSRMRFSERLLIAFICAGDNLDWDMQWRRTRNRVRGKNAYK